MVQSGWRPSKGFGLHPDFLKDAARLRRNTLRSGNYASRWGKEVSLEELCDPRHPEVTVIPRDKVLDVVDEWGDHIGFQRTWFPFSSTDFYAELDEHEGTVFWELVRAEPFLRLGKISQLGYLVPARPEHWDPNINIAYMTPTFEHTRWLHSLIVAILMEVTLARSGFSQKERNPVVLMAGCHDIATVAGGDPVKLMDPGELDEEKNFSWVLERFGLAEHWKELFGFDLEVAQRQVKNEGTFGLLLDALDKISYTALDCFHVGSERPGK
ncbi:MAG: hypothetical protein Q8P12_07655, partial [bacterium]|nr:hypothetical protein [bacterium]